MASQDWFDKDFYKVLGVSKDVSEADLKKASEERKAVVDRARQFAQARRAEISAKLTELFASLTNEKEEATEELAAQKEQALEVLSKRQQDRFDQLRSAAQKKIPCGAKKLHNWCF